MLPRCSAQANDIPRLDQRSFVGGEWSGQGSVASNRQVSYTLRIEKRFSGLLEQHRDRRTTSRDHAKRCGDANRLPVLNWPAAARVEEVTIPDLVDFEETFVIAAGRKGTAQHLDGGDDFAGPPRMANAHEPRSAVLLRAGHTDIASQIDEGVQETVLEAKRGHPVACLRVGLSGDETLRERRVEVKIRR